MSPKQTLRRYFSNRDALASTRVGRWLGAHLHAPELWHFGRRSVAGGVGLGFFIAFMPMPGHSLIAVPLALLVGTNLPITVASVWLVNPFTFAPLFVFALEVGALVTGHAVDLHTLSIDASWPSVRALFAELWQPLLVGCLLCGLSAGAIGNLAVRWLWRLHLARRWRRRGGAARRRG
ncbi:MAG: DUF2062 domain-containing protein [Gammaproteobacteria bacterium]